MHRPLSAFAVFLLVACGSSVAEGPPGTTGDSGAGTDTGGATDTGVPAKAFKTHVILGDSISDGGGESPFFYNLLDKNDDGKWPAEASHDFATRYPGIQIQKKSKGGATSANLGGQIDALPTRLDGPIIVSITIGGNDVQAALPKFISGGGDDSKQRADFTANLDNAHTKLHAPDRFGPGVQVTVVMTNIYDPSSGTGNFKGCGLPLSLWPAGKETGPILDNWEQIMVDAVKKFPGDVLLDMRAKFKGHGVADAENWFVRDCIHPTAVGHNAIRGLFWDAVQKL